MSIYLFLSGFLIKICDDNVVLFVIGKQKPKKTRKKTFLQLKTKKKKISSTKNKKKMLVFYFFFVFRPVSSVLWKNIVVQLLLLSLYFLFSSFSLPFLCLLFITSFFRLSLVLLLFVYDFLFCAFLSNSFLPLLLLMNFSKMIFLF